MPVGLRSLSIAPFYYASGVYTYPSVLLVVVEGKDVGCARSRDYFLWPGLRSMPPACAAAAGKRLSFVGQTGLPANLRLAGDVRWIDACLLTYLLTLTVPPPRRTVYRFESVEKPVPPRSAIYLKYLKYERTDCRVSVPASPLVVADPDTSRGTNLSRPRKRRWGKAGEGQRESGRQAGRQAGVRM
ncbi:hypothetical protein F4780DRAFT_735952, partial [Xylariomycetidae sp. FL0641]